MEEQSYQNMESGGIMAVLGVIIFIVSIFSIIMIIATWKLFTKAGKPGWASLIPIYRGIIFLEIIGKPIWWIFLFLIPLVNIVFLIIAVNDLSKSFGKDIVMTLLLILLPFIGFPMLAFGDARYLGPAGAK
jgi:uncharacterized membrane protein